MKQKNGLAANAKPIKIIYSNQSATDIPSQEHRRHIDRLCGLRSTPDPRRTAKF
jgi:hypothetical protein